MFDPLLGIDSARGRTLEAKLNDGCGRLLCQVYVLIDSVDLGLLSYTWLQET